MKFTEIDLMKWNRGQMFYYFSKMAPTGYSITVDIDVTNLVKKLKEKEKKFFPTYLWLVTKCVNKQIEFKVAYKDDKLGYYDTLTPLYASFHDDDQTFSLMWTEYTEDYNLFYNQYIDNQKEYGMHHGVLAKPNMLPPENAYTVSSVPWINFKHFSVHSYENKPYFFPSIEGGKIDEKDGKLIMPISLTCHHATTDGIHIKKFLDDLDFEMKNLIDSL